MLKTLLITPIKIGSFVIHVWYVVLVGSIIADVSIGMVTGVVAYNVTHPQTSDVHQHVIVFVSGLNTSMDNNCQEGTFEDHSPLSLFSTQKLQSMVANDLNIDNPYANGCNGGGDLFLHNKASIAQFSYAGGAMNPDGYWHPDSYDGCHDVNTNSLALDVRLFDDMLEAYITVYPNATFTLVGHSLGGLVALQAAYNYEIAKNHSVIDKVITLDSPLWGVSAAGPTGKSIDTFEQMHCISNGPVTEDLMKLGNIEQTFIQNSLKIRQAIICKAPLDATHEALSACKAQVLVEHGVGIVTLGNSDDTLFCGGNTGIDAGLAYGCYTQTISESYGAFNWLKSLGKNDTDQLHLNLGGGHGMILKRTDTEQDIIRYILAPVATIRQPVAGEPVALSANGTMLPYSANVHCLWGSANHAAATINDFSSEEADKTQNTSNSDTLSLSGSLEFPATYSNPTPQFVVDAGGSACQYDGISPKVWPTNQDYFGGYGMGVPLNVEVGCVQLSEFAGAEPAQNAITEVQSGGGSVLPAPVIPFPGGSLGHLIQAYNDMNLIIHYQIIRVCSRFTDRNTTVSQLRAYFASTMPQAGWIQSSTFPYSGSFYSSCGDPYCWFSTQYNSFASLEQIKQYDSLVTYNIRLATEFETAVG